ncbi:hypothetical protein ISF_02485 [Acetobacter orientalis]|uniref:Uncharacterized protein n=1 Tax=Acetobacter orientalis TaxID=146474 RepID=A0A2Z5ZKJ2_9PROT|nr:hypothetical protein ISF_02485 [Acetobacter orientalis]
MALCSPAPLRGFNSGGKRLGPLWVAACHVGRALGRARPPSTLG